MIRTVACFKTGTKYGPEYVTRLKKTVARHLSDHRFVCFTDEPVAGVECLPMHCEHPNWWGKLGFFRRDLPVQYPMLYLDLDMLPVGDLAPFDIGTSFAIIKQWKTIRSPKTVPLYNGSAMLFGHRGALGNVLTRFKPEVMEQFRSDQDWLAHLHPELPTWPREWFAAMEDCYEGPPEGCRMVICNVFENAPAAERLPWVEAAWR